MEETLLEKKLAALYKERDKMEKEVERVEKQLEKQLMKQLCPKGKKECEPAYCTFRITDTCDFLKRWRKISSE